MRWLKSIMIHSLLEQVSMLLQLTWYQPLPLISETLNSMRKIYGISNGARESWNTSPWFGFWLASIGPISPFHISSTTKVPSHTHHPSSMTKKRNFVKYTSSSTFINQVHIRFISRTHTPSPVLYVSLMLELYLSIVLEKSEEDVDPFFSFLADAGVGRPCFCFWLVCWILNIFGVRCLIPINWLEKL